MSPQDSAVKPRFRIAICGGGIAGLCLSIALLRYSDIQVDLYEAAESFKEIGAGVMVWGRAWAILDRLGLAHAMRVSEKIPTDGLHDPTFGFDFRKSDQPQEGYMWYPVRLPCVCFLFHRAHFLDLLAERIPAEVAHFRKRLTGYTRLPSGKIRMEFAGDTTATCDVLLGCDGIKSVVRRCMLEEKAAQGQPDLLRYIEPFFSGTIAYRALVPVEKLTRNNEGKVHPAMKNAKMYCGPGKHIVSYGIAGGEVCNVVGMITNRKTEGQAYEGPWVSECSAQELRDVYKGWEPEVDVLLKSVEKPMKWAIHQLHPLPFFVHERVALVGDAAHAMTPHQGAGAGQAIEDAYILAGLLGHPSITLANVSHALQAYQYIRMPMARHVTDGSRRSGMMYQLESEYSDKYAILGPAIQKQWDWVGGPDPDEELKTALRWCSSLAETMQAKL